MERMKLTTNNSVFHDLCLSKRRWSIKFEFYTNNWNRDRGIVNCDTPLVRNSIELSGTQLFYWVITLKPKLTILAICWRKKIVRAIFDFSPNLSRRGQKIGSILADTVWLQIFRISHISLKAKKQKKTIRVALVPKFFHESELFQ